jgi:hypothetical protein
MRAWVYLQRNAWEGVMKPDSEIRAIQERVNKVLPRILGPDPLRPVKVLVRRGDKEGTALVQLSYPARGEVKGYDPGKQLTVSSDVELLSKWTDLAFADFVAKAVRKLLSGE